MIIGRGTKLALAFVSLLFAIVALLAFNNYLGPFLMPAIGTYPSQMEPYVPLNTFSSGIQLILFVMFALAALYFARDLYVSRDRIFKPSKSVLISSSAAFFLLSAFFFLYLVWTTLWALNSADGLAYSSLPTLLFAVVGTLFGAVIGKILLNEYFGLKWHEHATPHVVKKITGRRR